MTSDDTGKTETIELSQQVVRTAGILLVAIVAVEYGGIFMFAIHRRRREFTGPVPPSSARLAYLRKAWVKRDRKSTVCATRVG